MIYLIVSRSTEIGDKVSIEAETPIHIKVPKTEDNEHLIVGFDSLALAQKFLDRRNIPPNEYKFVLKGRGLTEKFDGKRIFLVKNESQLDDMERDPEGYDYENDILKNAL
jgi:hypothetical protein